LGLNLKIKNVIFKDYNVRGLIKTRGLDKMNRKEDNNENYASLMGTKQQINQYLQDNAKDIISERLRTLNSVPKYRIINTTKTRIY